MFLTQKWSQAPIFHAGNVGAPPQGLEGPTGLGYPGRVTDQTRHSCTAGCPLQPTGGSTSPPGPLGSGSSTPRAGGAKRLTDATLRPCRRGPGTNRAECGLHGPSGAPQQARQRPTKGRHITPDSKSTRHSRVGLQMFISFSKSLTRGRTFSSRPGPPPTAPPSEAAPLSVPLGATLRLCKHGGEEGSIVHPNLRDKSQEKNTRRSKHFARFCLTADVGRGFPGSATALCSAWPSGGATLALVVKGNQPGGSSWSADFEALCSFRPWPLLDGLPNVLPPQLEA